LPGLPMFGHGQIEGNREKYGMEYRHAKWEESVDDGLVRGHEWRIFPLTHRRSLFANVEDFRLYDFYITDYQNAGASGVVNEDVFAYSNRSGNELGLVVYHNKYTETHGWIKKSAAFMDKAKGKLDQETLPEAFSIPSEGYAIFKDYVTGLEYIRSCRELTENGLFIGLGGYKCHVFLDWKFVFGDQWGKVDRKLGGSGTPNVQKIFDEFNVPLAEVNVVPSKRMTKSKEVLKKTKLKKSTGNRIGRATSSKPENMKKIKKIS